MHNSVNPPGRNENILIVSCPLDPDWVKSDDPKKDAAKKSDPAMSLMASDIRDYYTEIEKKTVTLITCEVLSNPVDEVRAKVKNLGSFTKLLITGHSRFFRKDEINQTLARDSLEKQVMDLFYERRVGGYKFEEMIPLIVYCVTTLKVKDICIVCCEVGLNIDTYLLYNPENYSALPPKKWWNRVCSSMKELKRIEQEVKKNNNGLSEAELSKKRLENSTYREHNGMTSTLEAIAFEIIKDQNNSQGFPEITLQGLNGVGYITYKFLKERQGALLTFDQQHLKDANAIGEAQKKSEADAAAKEKVFVKNCIDTKKSPHLRGYKFKPSEFKAISWQQEYFLATDAEKQNIFPSYQFTFSANLSQQPILLNGMKVIFDQPVGIYPVTLESKEEKRV